jgi:hypothetical protein
LSKQSPIEPIEASSPESLARWVKAQEANWVDSSGRRNTSSLEVWHGATTRVGVGTDGPRADALAGAAAAQA